jgi:hypothetical protein
MATVLSSKTFSVSKGAEYPYGFIEEWFNSIDRKQNDCRLVVRLEVADKSRNKDDLAKKELERLLDSHKDKAAWSRLEYDFSFSDKKYIWKRREIHITPNEALFLFRWLVLNDETHKTQRFYLSNMRQKFGKDFLNDIQESK